MQRLTHTYTCTFLNLRHHKKNHTYIHIHRTHTYIPKKFDCTRAKMSMVAKTHVKHSDTPKHPYKANFMEPAEGKGERGRRGAEAKDREREKESERESEREREKERKSEKESVREKKSESGPERSGCRKGKES